MSEPVPVAEVVRSGFVESVHHGSVVVLAADGSVQLAVGDVVSPIFPRSSNKPVQAAAMVRAGLPLAGELLALGSASHSGEPFHLDGVRRMGPVIRTDSIILRGLSGTIRRVQADHRAGRWI